MKSEMKLHQVENMYPLGKHPLLVYVQHHAEKRPHEAAYFYYGSTLTWAELLNDIEKMAGFLTQKGFEKGDRVGLYMQNSPQYIIAHYAIQSIGGIVCPLNPMYKASELTYLMKEVGMKGLFTGGELLSEVRKTDSDLHAVLVVSYEDYIPEHTEWEVPGDLRVPDLTLNEKETHWSDAVKEAEPQKASGIVDMDDTALLAFTSGTTGRPKAAMLTYENALYKTAAAVEANGVEEEETWLAVMPLCHIAGMVMGVNIPAFTGSPCVLFARFDPRQVVTALTAYDVSVWYSIAPMNEAVLSVVDGEKADALRLNLCTSFGMPVTEALAERWRSFAPDSSLYEAAYGLSETHTVDTYMPGDGVKFGSVGLPVPGSSLAVRDPLTKEDQPAGEAGEIAVKSPGVFKGYWGRPEATAEVLADGWMHTGDIGYFDEDGYLYFQGRLKEMIKSSGFSIFPEDVEALMKEHPAISQAAVIGVPDESKGEVVKAFIVLKEESELEKEELIQWAKAHMARYKVPAFVEFRPSLPQTGAGKILRRVLKEESRN
ncbi:AMP-binding protein [Halobacillus litoralis]|uniref:AMP-binding protein n=1 Tax=Halobacillus litoralis TaxID=45668 RepID=A0A845DS18_9BACI|nr:class I adenylate-forming enzyme family protein [Halobacillus litoralis]MYL19948.1 AMP-binding protein [Halobacillus litoralis]